jgi:glutaredoxin 3
MFAGPAWAAPATATPSRRAAAGARYFRAGAFQEAATPFSKGARVSQPKVEIYTKFYCGYCYRAKRLLDAKGVEYAEYDITLGGPKRAEMLDRNPDAHTVPQIFIDGRGIGGSDDLAQLDREGKLDGLLGL